MQRLIELFSILTVLVQTEGDITCQQNEDCASQCCLFARGHVGRMRGTCQHFVDYGDYCIPGNTRRRFLNKYVYLSSCPCVPPLECLPQYTFFKDQITAFINPTCQIAPTEPTTPTTETPPTPTPSTTPCPPRGTFQLNLSISVPFDQKDQIQISAFGNKV